MKRRGGEVMDLRGESALSFINSRFSENQINDLLGVEATRTITKGQPLRKTDDEVAEKNIWILKERIAFNETPGDSLARLLDRLPLEQVQMIAKACEEVRISVNVRSELGQIGFSIEPEVLARLVDFGIRLDVDILSFGMVEK
ncbi:hypothetical protein B9G55_07120 [Saccharibacillus sp. O16]|nr:hypothetical protein B9G55_07120 [Saccharibacillus sp. O16]